MAVYTTLAQVKLHIGLATSTTDQDSLINQMILRVRGLVDMWTRTWWDKRTQTITTEAFHSRQEKLFMPAPVISLTSVKEGIDGGQATGTAIAAKDYRIYRTWLEKAGRGFWSTTQLDIEIKGDFGYATVLDDIKWLNEEIIGVLSGMKTKGFIQDSGVERTVLVNEMPADVQKAIFSHRLPSSGSQKLLVTA